VNAVQLKGEVGSLNAAVKTLQDSTMTHHARLAQLEEAVITLEQRSAAAPANKPRPTTAGNAAPRGQDPWHRETVHFTSPMPKRDVKNNGTPFSERSDGLLGNVGWNTSAADLRGRAEVVIAKAGIGHLLVSFKPTFDRAPGSRMDLLFKSPQALQEAREKVEQLAFTARTEPKEDGSPPRPVWIIGKKTREELRPNRLIKRAMEFILDMETTHHTNDVRAVT
jgi:hypothetical protein